MANPELPPQYLKQAEMLANRVRKRFAHLNRRFARENIAVFRLYDWDIPEIRAAVDWYAGHLVVSEYLRRQSAPEWLPLMGSAAAQALGVPPENVHLKQRRAGRADGVRYRRLAETDRKMIVSERDLQFLVNLDDFVDTGLFADHRETRRIIRAAASGKDFLNLFCYTAAFTCYAARGGARSTVSVDRSETALAWAKENLALNRIPLKENTLIQADVSDFLHRAKRRGQSFDLAVVDPPSFSFRRSRRQAFDVAKDHPDLLGAVIGLLRPGALLFFSTNHQGFEPHLENLKTTDVKEITAMTIPEDYAGRKKKIHRCWKITV